MNFLNNIGFFTNLIFTNFSSVLMNGTITIIFLSSLTKDFILLWILATRLFYSNGAIDWLYLYCNNMSDSQFTLLHSVSGQ